MPPPLPRLLTTAQLPEVELRAAALDGELYAVGDGWAEIATVDTPWIRASSVVGLFGRQVIAAGETAAWIWMAAVSPPWRHDGIVPPDARHRDTSGRVSIREMTIDRDEIAEVAGLRVTAPARTALDLARASVWTPADERRVGDLCRLYGVTSVQVARLIDRRGRLPHRQRAEARLRSLLDPLGA
ncbi:type IV toxin-antitoxin system AbiEi family antitoxin [Frigoribacterium sp. CFBP 13712]|uniref:type IV toxin-antitoxin system AbiEi family antitoxin n=1 Tax=Frigoribacterium sp. CFBP 13712 TaxID=2775309 RepID=UPI00177EF7B1|nr:type IV toxin-antitoxin system AbiEi family antitoxin [Frigoribacterium sp. CFBP 13712]MBD8703423.1 hypothetical protein [Frigoribacterium sp. CFBP 13712]